MNKQLIIEYGNYLPTFFYMKINVDEDLQDLNKVSKETFSTFIHEYIHFLQDLFTTFGLINIQKNVDIIKDITRNIYFDKSKTFDIPFIPNDTSIAQKHKDLFSLLYGDWTDYDYDFLLNIEKYPNGLIPSYEHLDVIQLKVRNLVKGETKVLNFGAVSLFEYIAYCIEKKHFGTNGHSAYPYKTPEFVAENLFPEHIFNEEVLVSIAEFALNAIQPGKIFVDIIQRMKIQRFRPLTRDDVVKFCSKYTLTENGKPVSFNTVYFTYNYIAEKSLKDYFSADIISDVKIWIDYIFSHIRKEKKNFNFNRFLKPDGINEIVHLFEKVGSPIISNRLEKQYLYIPFNENSSDLNVPLFKAIEEVYAILSGQRQNCNLKFHCLEKKEIHIVNSHCNNSPWEKVKEDNLCPFAIMWKTWGLGEKQPITN